MSDWLFWGGVALFFIPNIIGLILAATPLFPRYLRLWETTQVAVYLLGFGLIIGSLMLNVPPQG